MSESNIIYIQKALNKLRIEENETIEKFNLIDRELKDLETHAELEALEINEKSQEITRLISIYKKKITLLWKQRTEISDAIKELENMLNVEQSVIEEDSSYQPFKQEMSNNVYEKRGQYIQPIQPNIQESNINNGVLGQASYQENIQSKESTQEDEFNDDLFADNDEKEFMDENRIIQMNSETDKSVEQLNNEQPIQLNIQESNINNGVLGQEVYQENIQSKEPTQEDEFNDDLFADNDEKEFMDENRIIQMNSETDKSVEQLNNEQPIQLNIQESNINNGVLEQASYQGNIPGGKSTQEDEFKDGLFDDEEKIKTSFIGRNGVKIVIDRITCKNGIYTISYDRHEKNKTIRGLKKTKEIDNKLLNKKYLRREFKKKNKSNLLNLLESNDIEFNLSYFLIQEFDKKFGTKIDQSYRNKELCIEYDLGDILTWKSLKKGSLLDLYRIALNQEKSGNAKIIHHSKMCLMMINAINKYKDNKMGNNQKNINKANNTSKRSKNEETSIQDWGQKTKLRSDVQKESKISKEKSSIWNQLESVRASFSNLDTEVNNTKYPVNDDFIQEKNLNHKKNNIFTRVNIRIASILTVAVLAVSSIGVYFISKKSDSKGSNDPKVGVSGTESAKSNVLAKESDSKGSNDSKDLSQKDTYNFNPEVKDVLKLVYRDDSGKLSREYLLTSDKFGEGKKYASSECGGDLFKISDIIVYNKDSKETIDTIKDEGLNAQSLYGKYGADIGVSICLNVCDKEFNVISNEKYYLDYDSYARIGDLAKQKIAENNSSKYAKEDEIAKTTEGVTTKNVSSEEKTEETKQPEEQAEKTNVQHETSYADSNNNARLLYTDEDGNIIKACKWTSGSDGTGTSGSAELLDCDSYKFSLVVARETVDGKSIIREAVNIEKKDKSVEEIVNELYKTYGDNIKIVYNFNGYKDGKLTDENLGFISKEVYDEFQNITLSEEDKFYGEVKNTLAQNEIFKGYKLTFHM